MKKLLGKIQPKESTVSTSGSSEPADAEVPHRQYSTLSTAYNGTKLVLDVFKESADVFPPLKSVIGGLTKLLEHYDVSFVSRRRDVLIVGLCQQYITNKADVQRLIGRVEKLGESLTQTPRKGDFQEVERREDLKRFVGSGYCNRNSLNR